MRGHRKVRVAVAALVVVVVLAAGGALAAQRIRSPAQVAADTAPPKASAITAPVERRALATEVIVRGTVRYGAPQETVLPVSALKPGTSIVSRPARLGARLSEGQTALVVSGRPVFVMRGDVPMHRDLGPGARGQDVLQLEQALDRAGFSPGAVDGHYDAATGGAVAAMYVKRNETPFGATDAQNDQLRALSAAAATARDALLQTRLALRTARRGATPADINQAQLDAVAAEEAVPTARLAITAALEKVGTAQDAIDGVQVQVDEANSTSEKEIGAADAAVVTETAAVSEALDGQAEAQRNLDRAPPETTPEERQALRIALKRAIERVGVARAGLAAAEKSARAARAAPSFAITRARADGTRAARELTLARSEVVTARTALGVAQRKVALARRRVQILRVKPSSALERELVAAAAQEAARTRSDLATLAARTGVQVPADEILFYPQLPLRVDSVTAKRGAEVTGSVMTVTNSRLAIDSSLSIGDAKLVRRGLRVRIEEPDLQVRIPGTVARVAAKPGVLPPGVVSTTPIDPARTYVEIAPRNAPASLVGASVKLSIAVKSTGRRVLAVPVAALAVSADGRSRVQVDDGRGHRRSVTVTPGLAAQGYVEIRAAGTDRLAEGDLVVVGARGR